MIDIAVNGVTYQRWETASVSRSIDSSASIFNMTTSDGGDFPLKRGDQVTIKVDGESKVFGFIDQVAASGDATTHSVQISGRDNTCDLIDSTVPDNVKNIEDPLSLQALCEAVISGLGSNITVIDSSGQDNELDSSVLKSAESGDKCIEYLQSYCRKKQVFLIPSGDGSLIIFRPGAVNATSPLLNQVGNNSNNVKSWSIVKSQQSMYNIYKCASSDNYGFNLEADTGTDGTNRNGISTDDSIRQGRYFELVAEESMGDAECLKRSAEEANIRRARSNEYVAVVSGFSQSDGAVWDIGQRVTVKDDVAEVNGVFIIRSVEYSVSISEGERTGITCAPIDAYTVQAVATDTNSRKSDLGTSFTNPTPPTTPVFKRVTS